MTTRTDERTEFLFDILVTAIENGGYGWFTVDEYPETERDADAYAVIRSKEEDDPDAPGPMRVDLDTIAKGLGVIQRAKPGIDERFPEDGPVLVNGKTGERLYLHPDSRKAMMEASRENDAGELDVIDALAILECGLFGRVTYA